MKNLIATYIMATLFMSCQLMKVSPIRLHHENLRVTFTIQEENWQLKQSEKKIKLLKLKVSFQL